MPVEADEPKTYATRDIGLAGFLQINSLKVRKATKSENGKFIFVFLDPQGLGDDLELEYVNSDFQRYDSAVRGLKKLCYRRQ